MIESLIKRFKSKTYRVAFVLSILTILEANLHVLIPLLPVWIQPYAPMIWAFAMFGMRELTKEPISEK